MKLYFRLILAALAATVALAACTKETIPPNFENDKVAPAAEGSRVIAVSFGTQTKTYLDKDGLQPKFNDGDSVLISNGKAIDTCEVSVDGDNATISTNLTGPLKAVYPYKAAKLDGKNPNQIDTVFVFPVQSGTFADANICRAKMKGGNDESLSFENKTAVFEITPPEGATAITITSLKPVVDGVARTGTAKAINTDGQTDDDKCVITVSNSDSTTFYVALVPGVNLSDLSFDAGETYGMKGIPTSKISTDQTAANTKYTIDDKNWHPYVTIGGKKWATENVGATTSNPYGTYFEWGNTTGHALKESSVGGTGTITTAFVGDYKFSWANCPYQMENTSSASSTKFTKYLGSTTSSYRHATATDADAMKTVLDLVDDAAYVNWGGAWRMPTGGTAADSDFTALAKAANESYTSSTLKYTQTIDGDAPSNRGVYYYNVSGKTVGVYFVDNSSNKLFFPAAGNGNGTSLNSAGSNGLYWSSSLNASNPSTAYSLYFSDRNAAPQSNDNRSSGRSVRPVSDL